MVFFIEVRGFDLLTIFSFFVLPANSSFGKDHWGYQLLLPKALLLLEDISSRKKRHTVN